MMKNDQRTGNIEAIHNKR